eukprot:CAMPEP_0113546102 /NCGR_PEP_ID=MMETSP0015_2-20120614/11623_1 /TAXON_ID=2838 /ORGANISM="Odontella" /LENGTH=601 /DNA_ID=CAMNT_0000446527 /DNA_START=238 /DNA_END=2043 /DNA_ORIENTATION=- /assembly_acc=CAM_ASM_000160
MRDNAGNDDDGAPGSAENDLSLVLAMKEDLAPKTLDRRWPIAGGRLYKKCFLHADAVEWMNSHITGKHAAVHSASIIPDSISSTTGAPKVTEVEAVNRLNDLIDSGFVSHVCGKHRFVAKQRTLFFRFHEDVIDNTVQTHRRWKDGHPGCPERSLIQEEKFKKLEITTKRLCDTIEKYSNMLDEANGKILVLEESLASIGFAFVVVLFVAAGLLIFHAVNSHFDSTIASGTAVVFVLIACLMWGSACGSDINLVKENAVLLGKLMRPTYDIEKSFLRDVEQEHESIDNKRESSNFSVMKQVSHAIIKVPKEIEASFRKPKEVSIKMRESSDLPEVSTWPHRPVFVCVNTPVSPLLKIPHVGQGACPLGVPFHFSSELFEGKCLLRFKNVPSDDSVGDANYFMGRQRLFQAIVQGRFKEELSVATVLTGHEFVRPLQRLPPSWMIRAGTNLIRRLAPGTEFRLVKEKQPRALSPLAATAQVVSADAPGNEPDITDNDIKEDVSMFGGVFGDGSMSVPQRKKHLSDPSRAAQYTYDTESVYTFDFYQSLLDCNTYSLDLGFTSVGLSKSLDGQPIQVLSKTKDGRYLWSFQIWNESLLKEKRE